MKDKQEQELWNSKLDAWKGADLTSPFGQIEKPNTIFTQNDEQDFITAYFKDRTGMFLDIGAADGVTFSNTRQLALNGWGGVSVEPNTDSFKALETLYTDSHVKCINAALTDHDGEVTFYEGVTCKLLSTTDTNHIEKWNKGGYEFKETKVKAVTLETIFKKQPIFHFISIDVEGTNLDILKLFPKDFCGAEMICIECFDQERDEVKNYLYDCGYKIHHETGENLIVVKQ